MRKFQSWAVPAALAATLALPACSDSTGPDPGPPDAITELPRSLTGTEEQVISGSRSFGFALLREVDAEREDTHGNTVLSPLSASMALGMALVGAEGETFAAMRDALGYPGMTREDVYASYEGILDLLLELDGDVEIRLANSAWSRQGFPFQAEFFEGVTRHFDATVRELDFSDPTARDTINRWVEEKTGGHIREIVQQIQPLDILFLVNALYFQGDWTTRFEKDETRSLPFLLSSGSTADVPTMTGEIPHVGLRWRENGGLIGEIPYGGQAFGMVLVVPGPEETVDDLLTSLDEATWDAWMESLAYGEASVRLPKLELEWGGLLSEPLKALGMEVAFDPYRADFTRLSPVPDVHISRVRQKTFMKVDEEGTTAAAATSVAIGVTSAGPSLVVDRPFLMAIRERLSGTVLFLGVVRDPR